LENLVILPKLEPARHPAGGIGTWKLETNKQGSLRVKNYQLFLARFLVRLFLERLVLHVYFKRIIIHG